MKLVSLVVSQMDHSLKSFTLFFFAAETESVCFVSKAARTTTSQDFETFLGDHQLDIHRG